MNKELLRMVELVALEKGLPQEDIIECLEKAMAGVCRKGLEEGARVRVSLSDGVFRAWRVWEVVADDVRLDNPALQMRIMDAQEMGFGDALAGEVLEEAMAIPTLSRVAARTLYQQLISNVRLAERDMARREWESRVGEMVYGTVKRVLAGRVILDVEGTEASLGRSDQMAGERLRVGARVPLIIRGLNEEGRGAPLLASRRAESLLEQLLAKEVPEIQSGQVLVRAVARDGRGWAKVAVEALTPHIDPVAACVGMRGVRIQAVAQALGNERIHLMNWCENPVDLVVRAMAPIQPTKVVINESSRSMDVAVSGEDGGRGQGRLNSNARLISKLTGWHVEIMTEQALILKQAEEEAQAELELGHRLGLDDSLAQALVREGLLDVESVALCEAGDLLVIEGMDEDLAHEIQTRARAAAVASAKDEEAVADELWMGLDQPLREALKLAGIHGSQDLADCAVDEIEGVGGLDSKRAGEIILEARRPWFEGADKDA